MSGGRLSAEDLPLKKMVVGKMVVGDRVFSNGFRSGVCHG
jgi:hypothetical protein